MKLSLEISCNCKAAWEFIEIGHVEIVNVQVQWL